ncbi:hypothetical protein KGM_206038 [Danaus plexippus plexippus]|uniref:Uncharacterized protein n=2 Tax=Danaus plexippus TaxID=13037 RepID=A0A212EGL8_DANPL|nr:hypothetical protein KGM_206038 [Danaus plexippus plexippus]
MANAKGTQVQSKPKNLKSEACPWLCNSVPINVPGPGKAQAVLHPGKDVFVLKVAKIGANGDRRCKMELELVTPKSSDKSAPYRVDTRDTQCDPDPPPCGCCNKICKKKRK